MVPVILRRSWTQFINFLQKCVKVLFALVFLLILIVQSAQGAHVAVWKIILMTALVSRDVCIFFLGKCSCFGAHWEKTGGTQS